MDSSDNRNNTEIIKMMVAYTKSNGHCLFMT